MDFRRRQKPRDANVCGTVQRNAAKPGEIRGTLFAARSARLGREQFGEPGVLRGAFIERRLGLGEEIGGGRLHGRRRIL